MKILSRENPKSTNDQQIENQSQTSERLRKRGMQPRKEGELGGSHLASRRSRSRENTKADTMP